MRARHAVVASTDKRRDYIAFVYEEVRIYDVQSPSVWLYRSASLLSL